jgi:exopolyphosphatase/guanosine-5'-triphosphate,3'-diphosphate pyrophosphatase
MAEEYNTPQNAPIVSPAAWANEPWITAGLNPAQVGQLGSVFQLLHMCQISSEHTRQVTWLALRLFDLLQPIHQLGQRERFWLECAGLLHDIGWIEGKKNHHKASLRIILTTPILRLDARERAIIGSIARYHRKALPSADQDHFHSLDAEGRKVVEALASLLRLADGLDNSHLSLVGDLSVEIKKKTLVLHVSSRGKAKIEKLSAEERGDLFELVFGRKVKVVNR